MPNSFPLTIPRATGAVFALDAATLARGCAAAAASPRRRVIMQLHRHDTEGVQRMLNFVQPGSYARPHLHPAKEAIESIAVLQGAMGFVVFEPDGAVRQSFRLEAGNAGACLVDIEPCVWHTLVPLAENSVIFEIKRGPYDAAMDKTFPEWAPEEGSGEAGTYLAGLERLFR